MTLSTASLDRFYLRNHLCYAKIQYLELIKEQIKKKNPGLKRFFPHPQQVSISDRTTKLREIIKAESLTVPLESVLKLHWLVHPMSGDSAESDVNTESELSDIELSSDSDVSSSTDDNPQTFDFDDEDI